MTDIILYPTETLYGLGVNALDRDALNKLFELKGRDAEKVATWLVRDIEDIKKYAEVGEKAAKIAEQFLPGALTLVLKIHDDLLRGLTPKLDKSVVAQDDTIGFRISQDPNAQRLVGEFMDEYDSPITCTSANVSGAPAFSTVGEILQQFGEKAQLITQVIDDGPRKGLASTVVRVIDDQVEVLREGEISEQDILEAIK